MTNTPHRKARVDRLLWLGALQRELIEVEEQSGTCIISTHSCQASTGMCRYCWTIRALGHSLDRMRDQMSSLEMRFLPIKIFCLARRVSFEYETL